MNPSIKLLILSHLIISWKVLCEIINDTTHPANYMVTIKALMLHTVSQCEYSHSEWGLLQIQKHMQFVYSSERENERERKREIDRWMDR